MYCGTPIRERDPRPPVPRPIRSDIAKRYAKEKENIESEALQLYNEVNEKISILAREKGVPRSKVSTLALGGKKPVAHRGPNLHNAWLKFRMEEVNNGK